MNRAGRTVIKVTPRFTSQVCSGCGKVRKKDLTERRHSCECGTELDRDVNAAINIVARGRRQLSVMAVEAPFPSGERALHGTKVPKTI